MFSQNKKLPDVYHHAKQQRANTTQHQIDRLKCSTNIITHSAELFNRKARKILKSYTEEQRIAARYKQFGVTERLVKEIVQSGLKNGISYKAALVGTRLALATEFNQHEYFTSEDVAEATGQTVEEINALIEQNKDELLQKGYIAELQFVPPLEQ